MVSLHWLPAALPVLGAAGAKIVTSLITRSAERGLERKVRRHSELLGALPADADRGPLLDLINQELQAVISFHEKRLHRRLNGWTVGTAIVVLLVAGAIAVGLWSVVLPRNHGWEIFLRVLAVAVGLVGFIFAMVGGLLNLWKDDRPESKPDAVSVVPIPDSSAHEDRTNQDDLSPDR